jgi:hypothetical protein
MKRRAAKISLSLNKETISVLTRKDLNRVGGRAYNNSGGYPYTCFDGPCTMTTDTGYCSPTENGCRTYYCTESACGPCTVTA